MISTSIFSVGQAASLHPEMKLSKFGERFADAMRTQEEELARDFRGVLDGSSLLMNVPKVVQNELKIWEEGLSSPQEKAAAKVIKRKILELYQNNQDYIQTKVRIGMEKTQFEIAVRAISKTMSGVQQLLSSQ